MDSVHAERARLTRVQRGILAFQLLLNQALLKKGGEIDVTFRIPSSSVFALSPLSFFLMLNIQKKKKEQEKRRKSCGGLLPAEMINNCKTSVSNGLECAEVEIFSGFTPTFEWSVTENVKSLV